MDKYDRQDFKDELPSQYEASGFAARFGGYGLIIGGTVILVVLALSAFVWWYNVATSDVKGKGDATRQKNSGTNRIAAQERFEEMHEDILAADRRIVVMAIVAKSQPDSQVAQTNLAGVQNYCLEVVADYNAEARKYTAAEWRASDLPAKIDNTDPTTDCKEN